MSPDSSLVEVIELERYTLVQHSRYSSRGEYEFKNKVEVATVENNAQAVKVLNAGGVVFKTLFGASAVATLLNRKDFGEIPFSSKKISHKKNARIAAINPILERGEIDE